MTPVEMKIHEKTGANNCEKTWICKNEQTWTNKAEVVLNDKQMPRIIGNLATDAMLQELSCHPSPGLVSPVSNGAHADMNHATFLASIQVLDPFFPRFFEQGCTRRTCREIFDDIRETGKTAELRMLDATGGINTHRGMLFLLGTCCAAVGKAFHDRLGFEALPGILREMAEGLVQRELRGLPKPECKTGHKPECKTGHKPEHTTEQSLTDRYPSVRLTQGEAIYLKYQLDGPRGEVERGLPTVFGHSLAYHHRHDHLSRNDRAVQTLLYIMSQCDDTTLLHRHDLQTLAEVKRTATRILACGGMETEQGRTLIQALDKDFSRRRISPGGSADLLGITLFFSSIRPLLKPFE